MLWNTASLDKHSPVPLYYQLAELIRERIHSGEIDRAARLPSERELSEQLAISRMTARQAIAYLVRTGALVVKPGVGTFVAEPKVRYDVVHLLGFTEESMRHGGVVTSRVLEQVVVPPPRAVAVALQLAPGAPVTKVVRLRLSNDLPMLLETSYVPATLCPGLECEDLASRSLYGLLERRYGLRIEHARQSIEATLANDYESQLFGIVRGAGMILVEGVAYLDTGTPSEYFKAIYRGDRWKFELESHRDSSGSLARPRMSVALA